MKIKYIKGGQEQEVVLTEETPAGKSLAVRHGGTTYYAPLGSVYDDEASDLRITFDGGSYAVTSAMETTPIPAYTGANSSKVTLDTQAVDFGVQVDDNPQGTEIFATVASIYSSLENVSIVGNAKSGLISLSGGSDDNFIVGALGADSIILTGGGVIADYGYGASVDGAGVSLASSVTMKATNSQYAYDRFDCGSYKTNADKLYLCGTSPKFYYDKTSSTAYQQAYPLLDVAVTYKDYNKNDRVVLLKNVMKKRTSTATYQPNDSVLSGSVMYLRNSANTNTLIATSLKTANSYDISEFPESLRPQLVKLYKMYQRSKYTNSRVNDSDAKQILPHWIPEPNAFSEESPTVKLSLKNLTLSVTSPSREITVTPINCTGTIIAASADTDVCTATVSGSKVTITGDRRGTTFVTISVVNGDIVLASTTVNVSMPLGVPRNMLDGRTLSDIQQIFKKRQGTKYFDVGDYFDFTLTNTSAFNLDSGNIPANRVCRAVLMGIDPSGNNTAGGHFYINGAASNIYKARLFPFFAEAMNLGAELNTGGWKSCQMNFFLNNDFYSLLPTELKNVIVSATKFTNNRGYSVPTDISDVTATTQKIWLLSEYEVFGSTGMSNAYEQVYQSQYDFFKYGASVIGYKHSDLSATCSWWLRSPYPALTTAFCTVSYVTNGSGPYVGVQSVMNKNGFLPCFCIG